MTPRFAIAVLALVSALIAAVAIARAQPADDTANTATVDHSNAASSNESTASVAERVRRVRSQLRSPACNGSYLDSPFAQGYDSRATIANALLATWVSQGPADSPETSPEGIAIRLAFAFALAQFGPELANARGDFEGQGIEFDATVAAMTRALRILAARTEPTLNYAVLHWRYGEPKDASVAAWTQLFETVATSLPEPLAGRLRVDAPTATILWVGPLDESNANALRSASADPRWTRAIDVLANRVYVPPTLTPDERSEFLWRFEDVEGERVKQIEHRYRTVCNAPEGLASAVSCSWADPMRTAIRGYLAMGADIAEIDLQMSVSFDKIREGELISPLTQPRGGTWVGIVIALSVAGVGLIGFALWRFRKSDAKAAATDASAPAPTPADQKDGDADASTKPAREDAPSESDDKPSPERERLADAIRRELDAMA